MTFPWSEISGGAVVGLAWVGRTLMNKRKNGNGKGNGVKPGTSAICTKNIRLISGHEALLTQLCKSSEKCDAAIIKIHEESRDDYKEILNKIDNLKGTGG